MRKSILCLILVFMFFPGLSFGGEGGFTQEDRERLIRLEATLQTFMEQTNKRFEDMNKRFEQMMKFMELMLLIFTSLVVAVIGFAYWDRRTVIRKEGGS